MDAAELDFPLVRRAEQAGVLDGGSAVIVAPTATGKSYIGMEAITRAIQRGQRGPHVYLVPFRSLAAEVRDSFAERLHSSSARILISTGDHRDPERPQECELIVATYESFAGLMRETALRPSIVVADEVHLLADQTRGAAIEGLLTRVVGLRRCDSIIALSAVVDNPEELAGWLDVQAITGGPEDRPVKLMLDLEFVKEIDEALAARLQSCHEGEQALVFCSSRAGAERAARESAELLDGCLGESERQQLQALIAEIDSDDFDPDPHLLELLSSGVVYHHAGLPKALRRQIESAYRRRLLRLIACTPTLAAGVNLPAGVVVVRDIFRSEVIRGRRRRLPLPSGEILNMLGRAARPHLVEQGSGVALAKREDEKLPEIVELREAIAAGRGGAVHSRLHHKFEGLMRFVLGVIAERGAETTREHLAAAWRHTLAFQQSPEEVHFHRSFEEDMMEDLPQYARVEQQREKEPHKPIFIAEHRLSSDGVHAVVHSSSHVYEVTLGVTDITCTCIFGSRWGKDKICRHEALVIHDLLFAEGIASEERNRAVYNCAHLFGHTLDIGTKLQQALAILCDWRLIERVPGGWRATPLGFIAAGSWFDLLLVHQVTERVAELREDASRPSEVEIGQIAGWAVEDYFAESGRTAWLSAVSAWLDEVNVHEIKLPGRRRQADFERELEDGLANVCRLYASAAEALGKPRLAELAQTTAGVLRYGVSPELIPLMALGLPQLRRARCRHLFQHGIRDLHDLAHADPQAVSDPRRAPGKLVRAWIEQAREIDRARSQASSDVSGTDRGELDALISRFRIDPAALADA